MTSCRSWSPSILASKFSRHLLVYLAPSTVMINTKDVAAEIHKRIFALKANDDVKHLLTWKKKTKSGDVDRSSVDPSIYTNGRLMRMAYCTKRGEGSILKPILGSSRSVEAHLVQVLPPEVFSPPAVLPHMDLSKLPDPKVSMEEARSGKGAGIGRKVQSVRAEDLDSEEAPTPRWQPHQMSFLRHHLLESPMILSALKTDHLEFGTEVISPDGRFYSFNIKRHSDQSYVTCPYAGRIHDSNSMCLRYSHHHREVTVHCYDDDCSVKKTGKPLLRWKVTLPDDIVRAVAAAYSGPPGSGFGSASLHTCEDLISYSPEEDYCEDKMQPYPDARLLAIIANMGLGENIAREYWNI